MKKIAIHDRHPELSQIVDKLLLNGTLTNCPGLVHGKLGIAIFFFQYARYTGEVLFDEYAWDLIIAIQEQIHANYRSDYEKGIAGIGVGIDYLIRHEFIEAEEDLFEDFDERMYRAVMYDPFPNYSRYEGLTGYGWYWLHRTNSQMAAECLSSIVERIDSNNRNLSTNEERDTCLFLRAYAGQSELIRSLPEPEPIRASDNMGLSGGYAGKGLSRLTAIGAIDDSWRLLL